MRNPTMKKVESEEHAALIQELEDLEDVWKSLQKSRPRKCLEIPSSTITASSHHLFQTSPRTLMSSLQHKKPRLLRLKNCSNAVQEILMDRRTAISSGRFKGRQLFGEEDWINAGVPHREVQMNCDGGRGELPFPEEEKTVVEVAEERGGDGRRKEKGGGGCMLATACLAILLFVIALAFLCMSCNANYTEEFILVPT